MAERRFTMYLPVILVLILSIPLVYVSQWKDFENARDLSEDVVDNSGTFKGFTEDTSTTVSIIPDTVIDNTISDSRERVNITDSSGNTSTVEQDSPKRSILSGLINALIMVAIAVAAAFGIYKLFIKRRKFTLKMFFTGALGLCASVSIMLYLYLFRDFLKGVIGIELETDLFFYSIITIIGLILGSLIVFNMVFRSLEPKKKNPALVAFCILLGAFLAIVLPVWAVIPLITGVAVWDLWAAKKGIIKEMITESDREKDEIRKMKRKDSKKNGRNETIGNDQVAERPFKSTSQLPGSISLPADKGPDRKKIFDVQAGEDITTYGLYEGKYYSLGIGDFIFFAVLVSATFKWMMLKIPWMNYYIPGWGEVVAGLATAIIGALVILGLKKTLSYLDKENVMPGLPLSVLFGLIGFFSIVIFLQAMNMVFFGSIVNPF
jgi:hypothetical protein